MRYLAWFALPFCAAALAGCLLPLWWLAWLFAGVFALLFVPFLLADSRHRLRLALLAAGACTGFLWFGVYTAAVALPALRCDGLESAFTAQVADYPAQTDYGVSVTLRMESGPAAGVRSLAYLSGYYDFLKPGDKLVGTGTFSSAERILDGESSVYTARGVFLRVNVKTASCRPAQATPLRYLPVRLGRWLKERIGELFPGQEGVLLTALLTGDKSGLSDSVYSSFRRAGMAHLLAVSGLHVGFLSGVLCLIPGQKRRRVFAAIPLMVCFALMTGGQPPVWRAVIMSSLLLLAPVFHRESDPATSLSFALLLLLLQNPYAAQSVGLQLSFAAVVGLVFFQSRMYHWMMKPFSARRRPRSLPGRGALAAVRFLAGSISASCSAIVLTLPLTACYFGTVSLVGPLANLLCIWAVSVCFCLGAAVCALDFLCPPLGRLLMGPERLLLGYLLRAAQALGRGGFSAVRRDNLYLRVWLACFMLLTALVIVLKPLRRRPLLPMASAVCLLLLALTFRMVSLTGPGLVVSVLDVGQGACSVFCSQGTFVAVDCGGDEAGDVLADYIQSGGGQELALLMLTHYDGDHVNGVEELLSRVKVDVIALPDVEDDAGNREKLLTLAKANKCRILWIDSVCTISFGQAELTLYPPVAEGSDNASCASALCSWEDRHILVTGDMEREQEELLLEYADLPELDVLVVGHHGSAAATGAKLLSRLSPACAVISVGQNPYGHPAREVLERLDGYRCKIYRTDQNGTVTIRYR